MSLVIKVHKFLGTYHHTELINDATGNTKAAISDWDKYITMDPESYFGYYRRGWVKDHTGDSDGAITIQPLLNLNQDTHMHTLTGCAL